MRFTQKNLMLMHLSSAPDIDYKRTGSRGLYKLNDLRKTKSAASGQQNYPEEVGKLGM